MVILRVVVGVMVAMHADADDNGCQGADDADSDADAGADDGDAHDYVAIDAYEADDRLQLLYTLAQFARRDRQLQLACIYLRELVRLAPQLADPRTLLGAVEREMIQSQG